MLKNNRVKIGVAIGVLIIAFLALAYGMYNKPHTSVAKTEASVVVKASEILGEFETNEQSANTKYLEKIVAVSGEVADWVVKDEKGVLTLLSEESMGTVMCFFSKEETQKIGLLQSGTKVSVKGICTGYLMDVVLVKSVLTK